MEARTYMHILGFAFVCCVAAFCSVELVASGGGGGGIPPVSPPVAVRLTRGTVPKCLHPVRCGIETTTF